MRVTMPARVFHAVTACVLGWAGLLPGWAAEVDYAREVQPVLARRCFACHGPDTQEAGLRLDDAASATAELDSGMTAIVPGDAAGSELLARIQSDDEFLQMPPEGPRLSADEIASIRACSTRTPNSAKRPGSASIATCQPSGSSAVHISLP